MMNKSDLLQVDLTSKYGDKFLDWDLTLGSGRDDPMIISQVLDELPSVYEYFASLELEAEESRDSAEEELDAIEAEIREFVQQCLIRELRTPKSKPPTEATIAARIRIWFGRFKNTPITPQTEAEYELQFRNLYQAAFDWIDNPQEQLAHMDAAWGLLKRYVVLSRTYQKYKHITAVLHGRTTALKIRKDTLLEASKLLQNVIYNLKGLSVGSDGAVRRRGQQYANMDDDIDFKM